MGYIVLGDEKIDPRNLDLDNDWVIETAVSHFKGKEVKKELDRIQESINKLNTKGIKVGICLGFDARSC